MNKLLVTTDLSANSKGAIHFALQLASQTGATLIFYNVIEITSPTMWNQVKWAEYCQTEVERNQNLLSKFTRNILKNKNIIPPVYECICEVETDVEQQIIRFAHKVKADFICMSARGGGKIEKLFGTRVSKMIAESPVPLFVIPKIYRTKPIVNILYASDYDNLDSELNIVQELNLNLQAKIEVLHFDDLYYDPIKRGKLKKIAAQFQSDKLIFHFKQLDFEYLFAPSLHSYIEKNKPSVMVLFTKQNRNWFDRLFMPSKTVSLSYNAKTPMLVLRKK
ncbi:MAG: universal stress protein [Saprospiraceae bacterium]|jgi:nucleotide-binding universal stress UspA family protein|nr:universal stress protein [Saprospiraceae bacterium]